MQRRWIALAALWMVACQTHQVTECLPPCGASDQTFFARCVANGIPGECLAGNRRCCALAAECLGDLDDQHVVTTQTDCVVVTELNCWPACTAEDQRTYDLCLATGMTSTGVCEPATEECCALAVDCLGSLGNVIVTAEGCCTTSDDCPIGEVCDPAMGFCLPGVVGCGDGEIAADEECDDHNTITETCPYGEPVSCVVCAADCTEQAGEPRYCGDGNIDASDGEQCDPPAGTACDDTCHTFGGGDCFDGSQNGTESDIDCGGSCSPCAIGDTCFSPTDCVADEPECMITVTCSATGICTQCESDGDVCTVGLCLPAMGCLGEQPLDADGDGQGPLDLGCGTDCDDTDRAIVPGVPEICGDGVDQNCNGSADEAC